MRTIIKGTSREEVQKRLDLMKKDGWKPVMEIKPNPDRWHCDSSASYVCVVENKEKDKTKRAKGWGKSL